MLDNRKLVVLVADQVWGRVCKIGFGMRSIGWDVVLLHRDALMNENHAECFNEIHRYDSSQNAVTLAAQFNPVVYHVFSCWNFEVAYLLLQRKIGRVVFDDYDVFAGIVKAEFSENSYPGGRSLEKYCLENADAICNRSLCLQEAKRTLNYNIKGKRLYFPDYCWDISEGIGTSSPESKLDDLHLVHVGNLDIEKVSNPASYRDGWYFLEFAKEMAVAGIHFHLYPAPIDHYKNNFDFLFSDYINLAGETPFFHLHRPLPSDKLITEIAQYDLGLISMWSNVKDNSCAYETTLWRYNTSNKFFDYLDAGLGVVVSDHLRYLSWMAKRHHVGIQANLEDIKSRVLAVPHSFWKSLKNRVFLARKKNSIRTHAPRLAALYKAISAHDKASQLLGNPTNVTPTAVVSGEDVSQYNGLKRGKMLVAKKSNFMGEEIRSHVTPPHIFSIETFLGCDLKCPECAIGGGMITRSKGYMTFEQFKIIADKIRPYCQYLYLHLWGEPMLNPEIIQIIRYASQFTACNISTNGMCLTPQLAEDLILSGVRDILFSIDGMTQETYQQYRVGGDVNTALMNLKMLQYLNSKHGSRVKIVPQFVVFKHNQHEIESFRNFCRLIGLEASFKTPYIRSASRLCHSDNSEYVRTTYPDIDALSKAMAHCPDPRETCTILLDGSVVSCCYDHNRQTCFGNIFEQNVMDIWHSPAFEQFRHAIASGRPPGFCLNHCLLYQLDGTAHAKAGERARKQIDTNDFDRAREYARDRYRAAEYPECFDAYEQLVYAYPQYQIELLAEIYDLYHPLENQSRYHLYQSRFFEFAIKPGDTVLDIGSGHLPFPFATHLADFSLHDGTVGRAGLPFRHVDGKPVYECDIEKMPFADKQFDFVYCSHVLEHVHDPERPCRELMRVARRGFIETPTPAKDLWLNSAKISNHRWGVIRDGNTLVFREYTPHEIDGFSCNILMDMNCAPQTPREKAFAALLNLRADLANTMFYWEDGFTVAVHRNNAGVSTAEPAEPIPFSAAENVAGETASCVFINTYYDAFLDGLYQKHPRLRGETCRTQKEALQQECFGDSDFYSHWLTQAGFTADDVIANCTSLQAAWAQEHRSTLSGTDLLAEQIRQMKPLVVYVQDLNNTGREFLEKIRPFVRLIAGQIATPIVQQIPFDCYDLLFSSFPHYIDRFRSAGLTAYYQPLAFDPRVLERVAMPEYAKRPVACSFVGGISALHVESYRLLEVLAEKTATEFWGYGAGTLPAGSKVIARHHGEAWGRDMFSILGSSRITVNRHGEVAENYANNMRLFEATGCGALLITDYKDNLGELFEIGTEVVAYRSPEECVNLVNYYLAHPEEAQAIARAGQARTLKDHTYARRMEQTAELLSRHLRYQGELDRLPAVDAARVSYGHTPITSQDITDSMISAWRNSEIPAKQRRLVQQSLEEMYHGRVADVYKVLTELLAPVVAAGDSVLELGCASGYYYEILEYLLNRRIQYTGVDYSEAMISMAKDYYPKATFFAADGANLFFADRHFNVVISSGILLHVPNWRQHVFETVRVAGRYVIASRTPVCRRSLTRHMKKFAYGVETVELLFNEGEFLQEFQLNGMELINAIQYQADPVADEYEASYLFRRA